jgi:pimeloyl-ACP methyl ester carboxylesterase
MTYSYQGAGLEHGHTAAMTTAIRFHRWRSWGGAERRAMLLHGSTSSSATWWRLGPALAEAGWRVKAPDLLSHGASPRADRALTPDVAAAGLIAELADRPLDLVVGHDFGASVALALVARGLTIRHLVLDELPGPISVDWAAEAESVLAGVAAARRDPVGMIGRMRAAQPHWSDRDCQQAVHDLASSCAEEIADGLRLGAEWPRLEATELDSPMMVIVAPEGSRPDKEADTSSLRGADRGVARQVADAFVELDGGHCLHRDRPELWLRTIIDFAG